jgi:NADH-quinone oxidoreductase subunit N
LLFIGRPGRESDEATAKYFYLSILSSALLLYGFTLLYGLGGSTHLAAIRMNLETPPVLTPPLLPMALILVLVGLGFKLAAVPFHFYAPDVYQATTNLNAALLAVVPKVAAALVMVRLLVTVFPHDSAFAWQLLILLSVITMTLGNVTALWQRNVRRLLAYSSIAHAGYLLLGLAAAMGGRVGSGLSSDAAAAVVFYVLVYSAASLGAFASLGYLSNDDRSFSTVEELSGLGRSYPVIGGCLAVCMFSLSGIPPLAGFWGKFALFKSALDAGLNGGGTPNYWFLALCLLGVLNAAVAAAYYLRVVATLYFAAPSEEHSVMPVMGNPGAGVAALASVVVVIGVGLFTNDWMSQAQRAARSAWFETVVSVSRESVVPVAARDQSTARMITDSIAVRSAAD